MQGFGPGRHVEVDAVEERVRIDGAEGIGGVNDVESERLAELLVRGAKGRLLDDAGNGRAVVCL